MSYFVPGTHSSGAVAPDSVGTSQLENLCVTTAKLQNLSVSTGKLAAECITTAKIADEAVGVDQIAKGVITSTELAPDCIVRSKIADGVIDSACLNPDASFTILSLDVSSSATFHSTVYAPYGPSVFGQLTSTSGILNWGDTSCQKLFTNEVTSTSGTFTNCQIDELVLGTAAVAEYDGINFVRTTNSTTDFSFQSTSGQELKVQYRAEDTTGNGFLFARNSSGVVSMTNYSDTNTDASSSVNGELNLHSRYNTLTLKSNGSSSLTCDGDDVQIFGDLQVDGTLDVTGTKNFCIEHPLSKHGKLRHACIESSKVHNVYTGKAMLREGFAHLSLDKEIGMKAGTFQRINTDCICYCQSENGWTPMRGEVKDGILFIQAKDPVAETCIWQVWARRCDIAIKKASHTDDQGHLIVESFAGVRL